MNAWLFLQQAGSWRIALDLSLIGVFCGFYIVPLFALVQQRSKRERLARVVAANNILNALFMVIASLLAITVLRGFGLNIPQLLFITALLNAVVAIYIFSLVPEFLMRFMVWMFTSLLYRIKVDGIEQHVPDHGPAIIVCNHVSYMDALILGGAIPRPVRFVMYYKIFKIPILNWIFKTAGAIPIAGAQEDPELLRQAFEKIDDALARGEIVGIFPEGRLSSDGEISVFKNGVERILKSRPVPVVPMALQGMWHSVFSRRQASLNLLTLLRHFRAPVGLRAGPAVPAVQATAKLLEQQVRALRGQWA